MDPTGHGFEWGGLLIAIAWGADIGAAVGGIMAMVNGGNVWEGITQGAVSGAISGAMFYCAGSFINGEMFSTLTVTSDAGKAAVHTVAGASSGAVNAAITGGDVGRAALIGGLSAGMAKYTGAGLNEQLSARDFGMHVGIGSATGGIASVLQGGDFAEGAIQGAWASAYGYIFNSAGKIIVGLGLQGLRILGRLFLKSAPKSITKFADKAAARQAFSGEMRTAANRFFRGATSKSRDFKALDISNGVKRLEFFSPARNAGYGKRYVQEINSSGQVIREFKETIGPKGIIETKWIHGGP